MPTVDVTGFGKVNFPDNFTPEQIQEAIERDIVPNMQGTPFQKANAKLEAGGQVGFRADQKPGQEFVPGSYDTGGAPRKPKLYEAPQSAPEGNLGAAIKDSFAADEGTRLRLIAESLFPGDPKGIERVGIRNGKPVFVNDEGKLQYVSGTKSNILGGLIGSIPEVVGGIAGSFLPAPLLGSTAGAMAGRGVKRGISAAVFDEPVTPGSLAKEVAIEGGLNLAGGFAAKGVTGVIDRGRSLRFTNRDLANAEQKIQRVRQNTGIDLDIAQASGDRRLIALRDFIARNPGQSAELIQAQDDIVSGQFKNAVDRVLNVVARDTPPGVAGEKAINAAQETLTAARAGISQEVQPLYDAAYAALPQITDPQLLNFLKLPYFEEAFKKGQVIAKLQRAELQQGQAPDLRSFDYLKQGLDEVIQGLKDQAGKPTKLSNALTDRKNEFISELDARSGDLYKAARRGYQDRYLARVKPLEDGLVGDLARLEPRDAAVAAQIFNDISVTPEKVALLKAKISQTNPDSYRGLVRQYLQNAYNKAQTITQGGNVLNVPGKFIRQIAPNPDDVKVLKAILPPDALPVLEGVIEASEALAKTPLGAARVAGSNTNRDGQLSEVLKGRGAAVARSLSPAKAITSIAEANAQEQSIRKLTEALLDPAKRKQLSVVVQMSDRKKQAILLAGILGTQGVGGEASDLTENAGLGQ